MKRTRILIVAMLVAVLLMVTIGPMTASAAGPGCVAYHRVCLGENLFRISLRYGVPMHAIAAANGIWNVNYIRAGQVLCIPGGPPPMPPSPGCYCVRPGDTLSGIAWRFGTSVWAIAQANGIWNVNYIRVGQCLTIP